MTPTATVSSIRKYSATKRCRVELLVRFRNGRGTICTRSKTLTFSQPVRTIDVLNQVVAHLTRKTR